MSSLADDVEAVRQTITMQNVPVLLVGHSWGGAIITEAGNESNVRGLVYIAAGAPDTGQSFNDWWKGYPAAPGAPEIKPYGKDRFVVTLEGFRRYFAQDLPTDEAELLHCTQGPFATAANNERIIHAAWRDKPSWFIMGEQDHMLLIDLERDTARRMGAKPLVLQSSHVPFWRHRSRSHQSPWNGRSLEGRSSRQYPSGPLVVQRGKGFDQSVMPERCLFLAELLSNRFSS